MGGLQVLSYEQWANEGAFRDAPQIRPPNRGYRLYRSQHGPVPQGELQPLIVVVVITFDGPDRRRLEHWIDGVLQAMQAEPAPIPGPVSAHFHARTGGTQVLCYAEWTSGEAYDEALAVGPPGIGQTNLPQWQDVRAFSGVTGNTVTRYAPHRNISLVR